MRQDKNYDERMLAVKEEFDNYLSKYSSNSSFYLYIYFIRNLYSAYHELNRTKINLREIFGITIQLVKTIIAVFYKYPILTEKSEITYLNAFNPEKDGYLANQLKINLSSIKYKANFSKSNFISIPYLIHWLIISIRLLTVKKLNKIALYKCLPSMLLGIHVYKRIDLNGIDKLITMYDRYPVDIAIIRKAKENGIKTIRIDYFPPTTTIGMGFIDCEYYFYPNIIAKNVFLSFPENKDVEFYEGGFPYWDVFSKYQYIPYKNPKIISFWTDYADIIGIEGLDKMGSIFYIKEILSIMPEDFSLWIKVHPLDSVEKYQKFNSDSVKIIKHGEIDNNKLFSISSFIISIFSSAIYEAKHICPNSFFINYSPDLIGADCKYEQISDYIDLISNRQELKEFITGKRKAKKQSQFLKYFNPGYPHSIGKLRNFIDNI